MLKLRLIGCLLLDGGVLSRTKRFVPDYRYTVEFVGAEHADEMMIVDVTKEGPSPEFAKAARAYADKCFVPVAMGGWVRTLDDCKRLFDLGADKIVVGRAADYLCWPIAEKYGSQACVAGVDAAGFPSEAGRLDKLAGCFQKTGAGEIFLQSVERDGSLGGYDIPLLKAVVEAVDCPVLIGGGVGNWRHLEDAFLAGAAGCVTSNIFHLTDGWMAAAKKALIQRGMPVRPVENAA